MANRERNDPAKMNGHFRILSISDDDGLRYSRELLLLKEGYDTESVTSDALLSVARVRSFDVALICRSVDSKHAMKLIEMLHRYNPEMKIMHVASPDDMEPLDISLQIASEPQLFLGALRELSNHRAPIRKSIQTAHRG